MRMLACLLLLIGALYAKRDENAERDVARASLNYIPQMSYWDAEAAEKEEKRRKKYRLGNVVQKNSTKSRGATNAQVVTLENKIRMSREPSVRSHHGDFAKSLLKKIPGRLNHVRYPTFIPQYRESPIYLKLVSAKSQAKPA